MNTSITIKAFEPWMGPQVIKMFSEFYGKPEADVLSIQNKFFNHPFQKNKVIKIVAMIDEKVIGFSSFSYWPYKKEGVLYNSYQVGNAMIHPDYRGKRIFPMLLKYVDDHHEKLGVDFLFAFPHITASYPSFMRFGYINPFDLIWGIKIINPLAFLFNYKAILKRFSPSAEEFIQNESSFYKLERTKDFDDWFFASRAENNYAYYNYKDGVNKVTFYLKSNKRGKWINELIIGDIRTNGNDPVALKKAFSTFFSIVRRAKSVTIISIAYNDHLKSIKNLIFSKKFRKIKPVIHFVYRNYLKEIDLSKIGEWELYRGDIDTW
jgi:hypothetical protein